MIRRPAPEDRYDLVLVPVRAEQLTSTLPVLTAMTDGSAVLFFGNIANRATELVDALGARALFGFPAAGGTREGSVITYVLIDQQKTMLGEPAGATTARVRHLQGVLNGAGFPTVLVTAYWRRVLAGPRGELWFAAHSRAAPEEMRALAQELHDAVRRTGHATPDLDRLLA
ncbi:MAG: hypothetical protein M3Y42_10225 [Actinomycetota bacterium]|nr:hypothetical protein [Actinomycetota bacterium]